MNYLRLPRAVFFALVCCAASRGVFALDLSIGPGDLRISQGADGGYHLYIRKKPDVNSIMLCETTRDPTFQADTYAYRAQEANAVNGDEKRVLNGKFIAQDKKNTYLMDSTVEYIPELRANVFHIYIPYIIVYGYPDHRHGEVYVGNGTFLNIRAFSLPFGDYSGPYEDNPYELQVVQKPLAGPPEANYMKEAREALTDITARGGGELALSTGRGDICGTIRAMAAKEPGDSVDVVIVLDTTNSMKNDIEAMKKDLAKELQTLMAEKKTMRIGFMLFRDYGEQYLTRTIAFSSDIKKIQASLNSIRVAGGKDIPEAIHEAIRDAAVKMDWFGSSRLMLLITDAPPHLRPRGKITLDDALREAKQRSIKISAILLPQ